jgi:RecA/RadA recombinase
MAAKIKEEKVEKEEKKKLGYLGQSMKDNSGDHYNDIVPTLYKISTSSLKFDAALGGGFGPGIIRFGGSSEGGKTSCALEVARNFIETIPNSKVLYIKAEGRLGKDMKSRSGLVFTEDVTEWEETSGKAFVLKSNIFDFVAQTIYDLIIDNPKNFKYFIIIDSIDGLMLRADTLKKLDGDESVKVAGPNVLIKRLFKLVSLPANEHGHMVLPLAQVIAKIENKYTPKDQLDVSGGGGNAQIHFSNWCIEFKRRNKEDLITKDGKAANLEFETYNIAGHYCKVEIEKSENESTKRMVKYPIKYGVKNGSAIWTELEIRSMLEMYGLLTIAGRSNTLSQNLRDGLTKILNEEVPEKFSSGASCIEYFTKPNVLKATKQILRDFAANDDLSL